MRDRSEQGWIRWIAAKNIGPTIIAPWSTVHVLPNFDDDTLAVSHGVPIYYVTRTKYFVHVPAVFHNGPTAIQPGFYGEVTRDYPAWALVASDVQFGDIVGSRQMDDGAGGFTVDGLLHRGPIEFQVICKPINGRALIMPHVRNTGWRYGIALSSIIPSRHQVPYYGAVREVVVGTPNNDGLPAIDFQFTGSVFYATNPHKGMEIGGGQWVSCCVAMKSPHADRTTIVQVDE